MDLSVRYLGLRLAHPLIAGASPLSGDLDMVRRLEDSHAAAIVLNSLFEEQITGEQLAMVSAMDEPGESFAEALSYLPSPSEFRLGPEEYLEHLARVKAAVAIPVIASLNGATPGGWLSAALLLEDAGADALELNVYQLATDPELLGADLEERILTMVASIKERVRIPLAVKLSPFHTSLAHFAARLAESADGLVLFNRFYQPDIDIERLEVERTLHLSTAEELPLRLTWLAVLSAQLKISLAASGGVHTAFDAVKAMMAGAHVVQMVSALLQRGPEHLRLVHDELDRWISEHGYSSLAELRGSMNLSRCPDPAAYERANYMRMLLGWRGV